MSLETMSFCDIDECSSLASVCVPCPQVLGMNRRAEWPTIDIGAIDSAGCQVIVRDAWKSSIGRCKVFEIGVSIFLLMQFDGKIREAWENERSSDNFCDMDTGRQERNCWEETHRQKQSKSMSASHYSKP